MKVIVSNIQRFCLHDGPGIRTTVFFKGCNLRCPWCSNPENISFDIEEYNYNNQKGEYGKEYTLDELKKEILKDKNYYENDGGVTFSGGEPLFQMKNIEELLNELKKEKINICIETALTVPKELVRIALKYVDEFIIDIKILDDTSKDKINGNPELFLDNLEEVFKNKKNVKFRIPLVHDYTYTEKNINKIIEVLKRYNSKVEIFKTHNLSEKKYETLGLKQNKFKEISDKEIEDLCKKINSIGVNCSVIKI